jgi:hypothetical protein
MSLPASQQRVLDRMEHRLRADEPYLASMFGIFARLSTGEPVTTERLTARPRWRRPPGAALYAVAIFPVIFTLVIIGALLSGSAQGSRACDVGYSVSGSAAAASQSQCQTAGQPASGSGAVTGPAGAACLRAAAVVSRAAVHTDGDLAFPPWAVASPVPGDTSGMCYK